MFPAIGPISKIIKILHSDASPAQIAGGVCFGMIAGLTPLWNIHNLAVLFLVLIIRVNLGAAVLSFLLFSVIAFPLDPLFNAVGLKILKAEALYGFWTDLYNIPTFTFTNFNNSIVMGSLAVSLALFIPVWAATAWFVKGYRGRLREKIDGLRIVKVIKASSAYRLYARIRDWTE